MLTVPVVMTIALALQAGEPAPRGAYKMPYVRYEADRSKIGDGTEVRGPSFDQDKTEAEASERKYVALTKRGSYVEWTLKNSADGVVLRFTMPDSADGTGRSGKLALYINEKRIRDIPLTSYHAWQYFDKTKIPRHPHNDPKKAKGVGSCRMRFDEVRFRLDQKVGKSDRLRIQKDVDDGIEYGVDFIEVEEVPPAIEKPDGFLDATDFADFAKAIEACVKKRRGLYIPPGRYELGDRLRLDHDGIRIQGAGIWHTELYFTQLDKNRGGIYGTGSGARVSDFFVSSKLNKREGYRGFGMHWGKGSVIENIWLEHFSVGFWVGYYGPGEQKVAEKLIVRNCRIRNTYADGLNFAKGSRNCVLEHSNIRNTGDDAVATWSSNKEQVTPTANNVFRFNTIEHPLRAAGIGIFGGAAHGAVNCVIVDAFAGPGIRFNSVFPGHPFINTAAHLIADTSVIRCGTRNNMFQQMLGAIDLEVKRYDVCNIVFSNIDVIDSQTSGIVIHALKNEPRYEIKDVFFQDIHIKGTGKDGLGPGHGILAHNKVKGSIKTDSMKFTNIKDRNISDQSEDFEIKEGKVFEGKYFKP